MNIDDLKTAWQEYDSKLQSTRLLSDQLVISMIRERSVSRLSKVVRRHMYGIIYMSFWLFAGIAILAGNPFDYKQLIEYIPVSIYCLCMSALIVGLYKVYSDLKAVNISNDNIDGSLKKIISVYENPGKFMNRAIKLLLLSATVLFPLSFLPREIESHGIRGGIIEILIPISLSVIIVLLAYKLGAFKERQAEKFRQYMDELGSLKKMSAELHSE